MVIKKTSAPAKKTTTPAKKATAPAKKATAPAKKATAPAKKIMATGKGKKATTLAPVKEKRKKATGFEINQTYVKKAEVSYESIANLMDELGEIMNEYLNEGKRKNAAESRAILMDIIKEAKDLRNVIQESKVNLKPIYKS